MRITYLHQYFTTPEMSGGTRSYEFARRLVKRGHEVNMITSWREDDDRPNYFMEEIAGINVYWIKVPYNNNMGFLQRLKAFISFAWHSGHLAGSLPSDLIFATSTPLTIALPAIWGKWRRKAPMVFEVRDLWPEAPIAIGALKNPFLIWLAKQLERFTYRQSSRVIALAPRLAKGVEREGVNPDKICIIPNSSDLAFFDPSMTNPIWLQEKLPPLSKGFVVTYAGTIGRVNNVGYLVDMAKEVASLENILKINFLVIGNGIEKEVVREKAVKLGVLGHNFHMLAAVAKTDVPNVLAGSDVMLSLVIDHPNLSACSANKFFDALAAAKPICINHKGWLSHLLQNYEAGLTLPPDNPKKAAKMLVEWLQNDAVIKRAGSNALQLAKEHFNRDLLTDKMEKVFMAAKTEKPSPLPVLSVHWWLKKGISPSFVGGIIIVSLAGYIMTPLLLGTNIKNALKRGEMEQSNTVYANKGVYLYKEKKYKESHLIFKEVLQKAKVYSNAKMNATMYLGFQYYYGQGVEKNWDKAFKLFAAKEISHYRQMLYLSGIMLMNPTFSGYDPKKAKVYLQKSEALGYKKASIYLKKIGNLKKQ